MVDDQHDRLARSGSTGYVSPSEPTPAVDGTHDSTPAGWSDAALGHTDGGDPRSESAAQSTVEAGAMRDMPAGGEPPEPARTTGNIRVEVEDRILNTRRRLEKFGTSTRHASCRAGRRNARSANARRMS